jgi:hypothetical protein
MRKPVKLYPLDPASHQAHNPTMPSGALATVNPANIIQRYLAGEDTESIAASLGVTRQGLGWHLRHTAEEQWKDAQVILATERKDRAEKALETAPDALSLARAREQLRAAQWDLERILKRIYGPSAELTGKDGGPLTVEIVQFAGRTIEAEVGEQPIADAQSTAALPIK